MNIDYTERDLEKAFAVKDLVEKTTGDYKFRGVVVGMFTKLNNTSIRIVVENSDGILHIFNPTQLKKV